MYVVAPTNHDGVVVAVENPVEFMCRSTSNNSSSSTMTLELSTPEEYVFAVIGSTAVVVTVKVAVIAGCVVPIRNYPYIILGNQTAPSINNNWW
jgi:hypothetical protein